MKKNSFNRNCSGYPFSCQVTTETTDFAAKLAKEHIASDDVLKSK
jgi:hypothetical protein